MDVVGNDIVRCGDPVSINLHRVINHETTFEVTKGSPPSFLQIFGALDDPCFGSYVAIEEEERGE